MSSFRWQFVLAIIIVTVFAFAQQQLPDAPRPQNSTGPLPDAPQSQSPVPSASAPAPNSNPSQPTDGGAAPTIPAPTATATPDDPASTTPPPMPPVTRRTGPPNAQPDSREQQFTLSKSVNFVTVPVTVKDRSGRIVTGLLPTDFSVYEDGVRQRITLFTSDPFPLSASVVIDVGMSTQTLKHIQNSLSSLQGAFSQFDELALYTFAGTVKKVQDATAATANIDSAARSIRAQKGTLGPQVTGGPLVSGPSVNGKPVNPGQSRVEAPVHESHVLNDAILAAALDLARRDRAPHWQEMQVRPRKVIFVFSEGREDGSRSSYSDVLKVLLTNEISVYSISTEAPGFRQLDKFRIPGVNKGDVLGKYASATGGQVYPEFNQSAIEDAYGQMTGDARNQYTLGYTSSANGINYRSVEVRVRRPDLRIYARDGYYPVQRAASR